MDLNSRIVSGPRMTESEIRGIMYQIVDSLGYLHSRGVAHRDLKPANILMSADDGCVKICDMGLSRAIALDPSEVRAKRGVANLVIPLTEDHSNTSHQGTPYYMAPELHLEDNGQYSTTGVDVWAVGCILAELLLGERIFEIQEGRFQGILQKIIDVTGYPTDIGPTYPVGIYQLLSGCEKPLNQPKSVRANLKAYFDSRRKISGHALDFLAQCFQFDPVNRPSIKQLLKHPFIKLAPQRISRQSPRIRQLRDVPIVLPYGGKIGADVSVYKKQLIGLMVDRNLAQNTLNSDELHGYRDVGPFYLSATFIQKQTEASDCLPPPPPPPPERHPDWYKLLDSNGRLPPPPPPPPVEDLPTTSPRWYPSTGGMGQNTESMPPPPPPQRHPDWYKLLDAEGRLPPPPPPPPVDASELLIPHLLYPEGMDSYYFGGGYSPTPTNPVPQPPRYENYQLTDMSSIVHMIPSNEEEMTRTYSPWW